MIPYETDPSLHSSEPAPQVLDDGFSPHVSQPGANPDESEPAPNQTAPLVPTPGA